jgi:hypothetical protein
VVAVLGLLACAPHRPAALGWSLGREAHVFIAGDKLARDWYRRLGRRGALRDALARRPLIAVEDRAGTAATVLSSSGSATARVTLARFHAAGTCGQDEIVTELVLAFPPGGRPPTAHTPVVALVGGATFSGGPGTPSRPLARAQALALLGDVVQRAESRLELLAPLALDADRAADAGEVVPLQRGRYAVGFRARLRGAPGDTVLLTGVADADSSATAVRWIVRPARGKLTGGMLTASAGGVHRYSVRGAVAGPGGGPLLLLDEIADVSARDSRAIAIDPATRRTVAVQPLALRCP